MKFTIIIAATILGVCIAVGLAIGLPCEECPECPDVCTEAEYYEMKAIQYDLGRARGFVDGFEDCWSSCNCSNKSCMDKFGEQFWER